MRELSKHLEHTLLKPDSQLDDIRRLCDEAMQFQVAGVCVPPFFVRDARRFLGDDTSIKVVTVVGFPMGYSAIAAKSEEIKRAADDGADELDAVINIAALKSGNWNHVYHDIDSVARAVQMRGRILKLILECGLLTEAEIAKLIELAQDAQVAYLKTSTGFHGQPTTPDMVRTLRRLAPAEMKIKASGGIRTASDAQAMLDAGAERIGTSATLAILGVTAAV